jgi:hypothetical protein
MGSEHSQSPGPGAAGRPAGPTEGDRTRRLAESVDRARGSISRARAKLDGVMEDVRALPEGLKTNVCQIIEHAFDELLAAERELSDALRVCTTESGDEAPHPRAP